MPMFQELPVRNTFVHFSDEDDEGSPVRAVKSEPAARIALRLDIRRRTMPADLEALLGSDDPTGDGREPLRCNQLQLHRALSDESTSTGGSYASDADDDSEPDLNRRWSQAAGAPRDRSAMRVDAEDASARGVEGPVVSVPHVEPANANIHLVPLLCPVAVPLLPVLLGPSGPPPAAPARVAAPGGGESASASWTVHAADIESTHNKICLEEFFVALPGLGSFPFQIILYAEDRVSKGPGGGFQRSRGRGRLEVRCKAQLPPGAGQLDVSVAVGAGRRAPPLRGPAAHDFSRQACRGWRRMDFWAAVDPVTRTLVVRASFALRPSVAV